MLVIVTFSKLVTQISPFMEKYDQLVLVKIIKYLPNLVEIMNDQLIFFSVFLHVQRFKVCIKDI